MQYQIRQLVLPRMFHQAPQFQTTRRPKVPYEASHPLQDLQGEAAMYPGQWVPLMMTTSPTLPLSDHVEPTHQDRHQQPYHTHLPPWISLPWQHLPHRCQQRVQHHRWPWWLLQWTSPWGPPHMLPPQEMQAAPR